MSLLHYFFGATGRISRQQFWLGFIVLVAVTIPVSLLLDPTALAAASPDQPRAPMKTPSLAETLWSLVLTWPSAAISIKRFNDRDRPSWIGYLLAGAMAMLVAANGCGLLLDPETMSAPEKLVFGALLVLFTWSLVDNGFQAGTAGANRYGSDPLDT